MAKGSRGGRRGGGLGGGGEGLNPGDILGTSNLLIDTDLDDVTRDEVSRALKDFQDEYGLAYNNTRIAKLKPKANALAYYDGAGVAINVKYLNSKKMDDAMKKCAESGFHPKLGNKTGMEATVSHELGHALTDMVGVKMGNKQWFDFDKTSTAIVNEARKQTKHRGVVQMASKISGYAKQSNAEAIAEAISDCYCNGSKAKAESKAIKSVIDKYLKK